MKKGLNIMFFSICFIAAVIAEAYFIQARDSNLISVAGIGMVVLITGYLLIDAIRSKLEKCIKDMRSYIEQYLQEEASRRDERYTETSNFRKATYTATKKNTVMLTGQIKEVLHRIDKLEESSTKSLQIITELQKKFLEGQKNSLKFELNHNKQNTRQILAALQEAGDHTEQNDLWTKLLESMEKNNELLEAQLDRLNRMMSERPYEKSSDQNNSITQIFKENLYEEFKEDPYEELNEDLYEEFKENPYEELKEDPYEAFKENPDEVLKDDPYEELKENVYEDFKEDPYEELKGDFYGVQIAQDQSDEDTSQETDTWNVGSISKTDIYKENNWFNEEENTPEISSTLTDEATSGATDISFEEDSMSNKEADLEPVVESQPTVIPLYDDPNKKLTTDEIAALFASFGQ